MTLNFEVESFKLDIKGHVSKLQGDKFGLFAATQWHKHYEPYVPMHEGILAHNVTVEPWQITHNAIYAHYQYEGEGFNFRRDLHPKACAHWDQAARATEEQAFVSELQAYIDSGRLF